MTTTQPPENRQATIERGTGISWDDWLTFFEPIKDQGHAELALAAAAHIQAHGTCTQPHWWAQGVVIDWEITQGHRIPGQRSDGTFGASVSKTLPGDMDTLLDAWVSFIGTTPTLNGESLTGDPRISSTEKWRYWRASLTDGTEITVSFQTKKLQPDHPPKGLSPLTALNSPAQNSSAPPKPGGKPN